MQGNKERRLYSSTELLLFLPDSPLHICAVTVNGKAICRRKALPTVNLSLFYLQAVLLFCLTYAAIIQARIMCNKSSRTECFSANFISPHRALNSRTCRQEADGDQVQVWLKNEDFKAPFFCHVWTCKYVLKVANVSLTTAATAHTWKQKIPAVRSSVGFMNFTKPTWF